jgi:hypothetical protein
MENPIELLREKVAVCLQRYHRAVDSNSRMAGAIAADQADQLLLAVLDAKLELVREIERQSGLPK